MDSDIRTITEKLDLKISSTPDILRKSHVDGMLQELGHLRVSSGARRDYKHLLESLIIELGNLAVENLDDENIRLDAEMVKSAAKIFKKKFSKEKTSSLDSFLP